MLITLLSFHRYIYSYQTKILKATYRRAHILRIS